MRNCGFLMPGFSFSELEAGYNFLFFYLIEDCERVDLGTQLCCACRKRRRGGDRVICVKLRRTAEETASAALNEASEARLVPHSVQAWDMLKYWLAQAGLWEYTLPPVK